MDLKFVKHKLELSNFDDEREPDVQAYQSETSLVSTKTSRPSTHVCSVLLPLLNLLPFFSSLFTNSIIYSM